MSEIINNKQKNIDIMKGLIRQLHNGVSEEIIRKQLETMLEEADYSDVFQMEMQLINEGIPQENIQKLCDTHTRVLKKQLDQVETPQTLPGHPVHTFIEENKELVKLTEKLKSLIATITGLEKNEDATELMKEIQGLLNLMMDVDKHYKRKENLVFPFFEKKGFTGPPTVMWGKHDEVREKLKLTLEGLQNVDKIYVAEAEAFILFAVNTAIESVEDMIYKEEKILFPTAIDILTEQDWYEIYIQSEELGYCIFVPESKWQPSGGVHTKDLSVKAESNRIQMPTGSFKLTELIAVFSTMPFDLTFVDKDDTVRYFSPGKDRVFDRSKAILGRKVQYCHPPKSVHIVNQIVADFKSGKEDQARFWIQMGPKFIYIVYYALRDENGEYLGTLEVTQDLTEIKKLEGERRLLTYDNKN